MCDNHRACFSSVDKYWHLSAMASSSCLDM